ncbi:hypothetical protein GF339_08650 [candidate division KSB3 bacterium]|uniref:Uncharacterized protein n=1 Tax=candidate division KSB3 bacterium TaxID=2044937 RepID=A0A9D5JUT0_9BACT|nr:hypothetical protein [candidate division KSB3 bacterium]MBD3324639.1 hypothetical protein [candidate division KSB3 bacterium]
MYWTEVKSALLYGQPAFPHDAVQPQAVQIAVREILRLLNMGWIDGLTEEMYQRIQIACQVGDCQDLWDEFQHQKSSFLLKPPKKKARKRSRSKKRKAAPVQA